MYYINTWVCNNQTYFIVLLTFYVSLVIGIIFQLAGLLIAPTLISIDKQSGYECGFDPFGDARSLFDISFYKTSILFLLFDLELVYITPLAAFACNFQQLIVLVLFLALLLVGFFYEWFVCVLEWV